MRWVAVAVAALAAVVAPASPAAASPVASQLSVVEDDAALLRDGPAAREATLDDMAALGADTVRIIVVWRDVPGVWPALDAAVDGARARGLDVLLTLSGPGPASASGCTPRDGLCRPDPKAYGSFVAAVAARYPSVHRWSLWNEPNVATWLRPQFTIRGGRAVLTSPSLYRALARAGAGALAAAPGHAGDDVLVGETAPVTTGRTGPPATRSTASLTFARALLRARLPGTGWAHHAYSRGGTRDPARPWTTAALAPASLDTLERELTRAARDGATARRFDVWLTEGGFQTNPPDPFFGVPPATQAAWINELDWIASRRARVRSVAQYLVRDEPARSSFQSGVRYADGRRKPSWDAYRAPLWVARTRTAARVAVWGRVRPRGGLLTAVQRRAPGAAVWTTVLSLQARTVERHVAAGPRGSAFRLLWRDASGVIHASRTAKAV